MFGQDKKDTKKRKEVATKFGKPPLPKRQGHGGLFPSQSQSFKRESNASTGGSFGRFSQFSRGGSFPGRGGSEVNRGGNSPGTNP